LLQLKREDQGLVETWLKAARARCDAGMDPPFQASLVEGEIAKSRLELMEAETRRAETWSRLRSVATLPQSPTSLADPGVPKLPSSEGLLARFEAGSMRKSIQSRMELETSALRHKEALGLSRWSLRGSYSKEGEERIAKLGFAYRFARPGETQAVRRETESGIRNLRKDLEIAMNDLDARFHIAFERLRTVGPFDEPRSYAAAIQAVGLRLEAGKERPSEALPIRRQLLEAQVAELRRQHALHLLQAELEALTEGGTR
jgi:outer membrane protein TolC